MCGYITDQLCYSRQVLTLSFSNQALVRFTLLGRELLARDRNARCGTMGITVVFCSRFTTVLATEK